MKLQGLHHITMITGDARKNVAFYADVLGLRLVKKTVNFDAPEAYHLYFGDEAGAPGSILTWFEFAGARRGTAGLGTIHTLQLGVPSEASLDFWATRLDEHGDASVRGEGSLRLEDPDGLGLELVVADPANAPLRAEHPEIPAEHAISGLEAARDEDHLAWQAKIDDAGAFVSEVRDRDYFDAIYFLEPRGILFEIATLGPGFAVDEDADRLGEELRVPKMHAHLRDRLEQTLTPLVNPRTARREKVSV
jgi:glyoxalase family protein